MKSKEQVTQYVRDYFDLYELNDYDFFVSSEEDEYGRSGRVDISLFPFAEMDAETLSRISLRTGLSVEEILNCDEQAKTRYLQKYPFVHLFKAYEGRCEWYSRYKTEFPSAEERLLNVIFTGNPGYPVEMRYDYADIKLRLIDKIKEVDAVMPGINHENAEITELMFRTDMFISFPDCGRMLRSFIDMVNRLKELFFKALQAELSEDEINEFNFLGSRLNASDVTVPSFTMNYDNLCKNRKVYIEENLTDFFSYVKIRAFVGSVPWRCKEFFDDMSLVNEFVNIFPHAKSMMREFAMSVSKFECIFVWSDAQPIMYSPEEEAVLDSFDDMMGYKHLPYEQRAKEHTRIYIEKTSEEMLGWEEYMKKVTAAAAPPSKGGLVLPKREVDLRDANTNIKRIMRRVEAKYGGSK